MPTKPCDINEKKIAQTLFLGASVSSFNSNTGWDGQPSQLTVNLIEDEFDSECSGAVGNTVIDGRNFNDTGALYDQFPQSSFRPNHYHDCVGEQCYIDKKTGRPAHRNTPLNDRIIPGKVYYSLTNAGLISKYWTKPDPGFFGRKTRINSDGTFNEVSEKNHPSYKYDLIDTPVYFRMGNFSFGGFVQSWTYDIDQGGKQYNVIINGPQSILNNSYVILNQFAGSIFSKGPGRIYGGPSNYIGFAGIDYTKKSIVDGNIPNVFNVYGFLESCGLNNFGGSGKNSLGLSINSIVNALHALTSTVEGSRQLNTPTHPNYAPKTAFSPFGRLVSRCLQRIDIDKSTAELFNTITPSFAGQYGMGVIGPELGTTSHIGNLAPDANGKCFFVLDLHDLIYQDDGVTLKISDSIRIDAPVISIAELLRIIGEKTGYDIVLEMIPVIHSGRVYNVIKAKTISRLQQTGTNYIENTVQEIACKGFPVGKYSIGREKNEAASRALYIGGAQQRLLQVKSYRLGYTQNDFIYNPNTREFIDYRGYGAQSIDMPTSSNPLFNHGKIRFPNFFSVRNKFFPNNPIIEDQEQTIQAATEGVQFQEIDQTWTSNGILNNPIQVHYGNYNKSYYKTDTTDKSSRWFPLHMDTICPFFGFVNDNEIPIEVNVSNEDNTAYRNIRPVWYDTWTGQIVIVIDINELPKLNVFLDKDSLGRDFPLPYISSSSYGAKYYTNAGQQTGAFEKQWFVLTESEIRAAIAGFDNFLVYSLAKSYKPDIIEMVRRAYYLKAYTNLINNGATPSKAQKTAASETDWYWKLVGMNIGGDELYPTYNHPDKTDGSQYIQEKALQDLKLIHGFIMAIAKYYGKKYMVQAPGLGFYHDTTLNSSLFTTAAGYGYIFSGDGKLQYNYEPTNDGGWEEYGNIIDDSIVVGSTYWNMLTDDSGKIKPLLGYNNNYKKDYVREIKCKTASIRTFQEFADVELNPYFDYTSWLMLYDNKTANCSDSFIFPGIDTSSLGQTEYVIIDQQNYKGVVNYAENLTQVINATKRSGSPVTYYDAWKKPMPSNFTSSRAYVSTSVEESFVYLDPLNKNEPRILIDAPGINLTSSSEERAKDPNATVISNVAVEDLIIYLKTTVRSHRDWNWIAHMLNYVSPIVLDDQDNPYVMGLYTISSNNTANNVELAPKAAHPIFAGIPVKSNQFVYGPWTNYPVEKRAEIFPKVYKSFDPETCKDKNYPPIQSIIPNDIQRRQAVGNLITNIKVEIKDDLVPWNYGGMTFLDDVAFREIESEMNYQVDLETAQVDMVGLPILNLGGTFNADNIISGFKYKAKINNLEYHDLKYRPSAQQIAASLGGIANNVAPSIADIPMIYKLIHLTPERPISTIGPIITSIQTSTSSGGVNTTYNFRTYTRKIGLFNREYIDTLKKLNDFNRARNKQLSTISQSLRTLKVQQNKFLLEERLNKSQFGSADFASKLYGWSPGIVLIGSSQSFINEPDRTPNYVEDFSLNSQAETFGTRSNAPSAWKYGTGSDPGDTTTEKPSLTLANSPNITSYTGRISTTVQLYERKEVDNQLSKSYGTQSVMSLDGILSPVSFYPTINNGTFAYGKYNYAKCPMCNGKKVRNHNIATYDSAGAKTSVPNVPIVCEKCAFPNEKLDGILNGNTETNSDAGVPINLITLNPIIVSDGEFKNVNHQNYTGAHPEKAHDDISSSSPGLPNPRPFKDRLRHCIEIVGRGAVPASKISYNLETSKNLTKYNERVESAPKKNLDYQGSDYALYDEKNKRNVTPNILHEMNYRFMGLRGPMVYHAWGYDTEGYPVPNAGDEPYAFDTFNRPMRFQLKVSTNGGYEDDLSKPGGFDPGAPGNLLSGFKGGIITKTQKFNGSKWTEKQKLKQFYLNWGERPDLWKVGPIDLMWDDTRKLWTGRGAGGDCNAVPPYLITNLSSAAVLTEFTQSAKTSGCFKMVYVTLEDDLIKDPLSYDTRATRGFIDDLEFSQEPLTAGYRRVVFVKDKCGYTAPKGTKLLCRYNTDSGFYEPVSKPAVIVKGKIISASKALIDMHYVQGSRSNVIPQSTVDYENPISFNIVANAVGIFSFINGKWTLNSTR
jgi:hypothetical protein